MIAKGATLRIERVPLSHLQVQELGEPWTCFPEKFQTYLELLQNNPDEDTDPLVTRPSPTHAGMLSIKNGKHRFLANILAGRSDTPCVIEEGETTPSAPFEEWHDEAIRERIPGVMSRTAYRRYREMGHNQVGALLMVIENLVYQDRSAVIEEPPARDEVRV